MADPTTRSAPIAAPEFEPEPESAHGPHVHVRVGCCDIVIPVAQVRQALPLPAQGLTALPRRRGGLLGVADADGVAVPIVALERWLPLAVDSDEAKQPRLLVLQHDGALVGIRVDAVLGVRAVPRGGMRRVHHVPDDNELFESVLPASADQPALCLLEVARLMRLSQTWCADAEVNASAAAGADRRSEVSENKVPVGKTRRHALFVIGTELWAVPIEALERVMPLPKVELALGPGERSWAISEWQGRKLPLVDISAGRQASTGPDAPWMALLIEGPLCLGLTVSVCKQFVDVPDEAVARTPDDALLAGIAVLPELGKLKILDTAKLFQGTAEASISRRMPTATAGGMASRTVAADATEPSPYLVFEADQHYASPVAGIVGVVELPLQAKEDLRNGQRAVLAWRGRTINVVNLPTIAKPSRTLDAQLAVLVQGPDEAAPPLGIAIHRLSDWLPPHSAKRSGMRMGDVGTLNLINAPTSFDNASLIVVDLAQMAYLLG